MVMPENIGGKKMSKKIKFTVFELLLLGGVALFMVVMLFFYHRPDMLSASLYGNCDIAGVPARAGMSDMYNALLAVFGALFMLFWVFFAVSFYLLQRRNFRKEQKKYLKKISECEARVEKAFLKFNNEIASLSRYLEGKIEKDAERK
jgi:hypothetical protein